MSRKGDSIVCACGFATATRSPLDLRPGRAGSRTLEMPVGRSVEGNLDALTFERPERTYSGPRAIRDSAELFSAAAPWLQRGHRLLDLGCGPRDQAAPAAHLGMRYVGVDFDSSRADILADAHAIPFEDGTFDAVLAYAVVEHLYNPFLALSEVCRVLRPGGVFFGAVSQGEPYHASFFHHTALGVASVFSAAGMRIERLWPSYDTLHSLATMGRYAKPIKFLIEVVHRVDRALPFLAPRAFFNFSPREKRWEALCRAASIGFVAIKQG